MARVSFAELRPESRHWQSSSFLRGELAVAAPIGTREIANLDYSVCVRPAAGYCSIEWSQPSDEPYSFTVSGDTSALDVTVLGEDGEPQLP